MDIFKVIGFGIVSLCIVIILRKERPEIAVLFVITASIILLIFVMDDLKKIIILLEDLINKSQINNEYLKIILKAIGISYIVEFGKSICKDVGETSIANKIEIAGKVIIVSISIPIITSLISVISGVIE